MALRLLHEFETHAKSSVLRQSHKTIRQFLHIYCHAIIHMMELKELMQVYRANWKAVEELQIVERRSASLELRWRQLNSAFGLAAGLGIVQPDPDEMKVYERWAVLKEKWIRQSPNT